MTLQELKAYLLNIDTQLHHGSGLSTKIDKSLANAGRNQAVLIGIGTEIYCIT